MQNVSVVIITYNEEANIADCIASVKEIASEILVLDSFSTDLTREIASQAGATVHTHVFDGHIQQKNRAKNLAKYEWVLSLDADERINEDLKNSISDILANPGYLGYCMNRLNFFCHKPIKTCGWYPDTKLRLWNKNAGEWGGLNPHDRFELYHNKPSGKLYGEILHFTYPTQESMKTQVNKFAKIAAHQYTKNNYLYLLGKMIFSSTFKFFKTYFFQRGFTSGYDGLFICKEQGREVFLKYLLAIKLKINSN